MIVCYSIPSMVCQTRPWGPRVDALTAPPFQCEWGTADGLSNRPCPRTSCGVETRQSGVTRATPEAVHDLRVEGIMMRTLLFKIHNPARETRVTLHRALRAYTNAANAVLDGVAREWDRVRAEAERDGTLDTVRMQQALIRRYHRRTLPYPLHSSLRESLFADLAAQLRSYDALCRRWSAERERVRARIAAEGWSLEPLDPRAEAALSALGAPPSWPTTPRTRPDYDGFDGAVAELTAVHSELDHIPVAHGASPTHRLIRLLDRDPDPRYLPSPRAGRRLTSAMATGTRPLFFSRADGATRRRNFALLRTERDNRFYALLYLLPNNDARAKPLVAPHTRRGAWVAVHPSGAVVETTPRPSCAVSLPLECGEWHVRTALRRALEQPEMVRVARLIHRPSHRAGNGHGHEQFFLAITFAFERPDQRPIRAYMGVAMDEESRVAWVVRDARSGQELASGVDETLCGVRERWRRAQRPRRHIGHGTSRARHGQAEQVKEAVHVICNRLIAVAAANDAQLGVQDVTYLRAKRVILPRDTSGTRAARTDAWHTAVADRHYRRMTLAGGKMREVLGYKLPQAGLPGPLSVAGISPRDCAACGQRGTEGDQCAFCGAVLDIRNAARVVTDRVPAVLARIDAARAERVRGRAHARADHGDAVSDEGVGDTTWEVRVS